MPTSIPESQVAGGKYRYTFQRTSAARPSATIRLGLQLVGWLVSRLVSLCFCDFVQDCELSLRTTVMTLGVGVRDRVGLVFGLVGPC